MSDPTLLRTASNGVLTLTLNRPEKYNALTFEMLGGISDGVNELRDTESLRVLLINANGKYFSAGMDMSAGLAPETPSGIEFRDWYRRSIHLIFDEIEAVEKPVIAAAQGPCLGGALEMSLSCDFRLASSQARYALPETNIGALPGSGGTSRLTRIAGVAAAKWLVMGAQSIDAERALQWGLVHDVHPDDEFEARTRAFADHLVSLPREVLGMAKLTIEAVQDLDRATARNVERIANTPLAQSEEHRALVRAFQNRKK